MKNKMYQFRAVLIIILTNLLIITSLFAQSPEKMSYQAVIRTSSDQLISNKAVGMQITIVQGTASGSSVYTETQSPTTNANGLVSIEIGTGTVQNGNFASIDWSAGPYFIKTQTDPAGGTNYTITGTSQLLSTPYALYAKKAGGMTEIDPIFTAWDKDYADLTNKPTVISDFTMNANSQKITNLATPVNPQDAATKAYVDAFIQQLNSKGVIVVDADDNIYSTIRIGSQLWMAENLKTTKYKDGASIPLITDSATWRNLSSPAYCWYDNDKATYAQTYGALYNWYAVNTGKLCPIGWHVPDTTDWKTLTTYVGGYSIAARKLKETGTAHWDYADEETATNETGFTALGTGSRYNGHFSDIERITYFWATSSFNTDNAWTYFMSAADPDSYISHYSKKSGFSIRCIKD